VSRHELHYAIHHGFRPDAIEARILAYLTLMGRPCEFGEIHAQTGLKALSNLQLDTALGALIAAGRVALVIVPVKYRPGDKWLRRDVEAYEIRRTGP
jgi:hypothetical protein